MKFLVIVSSDMTSTDIEDSFEEVRAAAARSEVSCEMVSSRSWFRETFPGCGDLTSWVWNTVNGRAADSRMPHFDVFVFPAGWALDRHGCLLGLEVQRAQRPLVSAQGAAFQKVTAIIVGGEPGTWSYLLETP